MSDKTDLLAYLFKHLKELKKKRDEFDPHFALKQPNWAELLNTYSNLTVDIKNTERKIHFATYNKGYLGGEEKIISIPKSL
jgi:galactose mutarotase-like enzyme